MNCTALNYLLVEKALQNVRENSIKTIVIQKCENLKIGKLNERTEAKKKRYFNLDNSVLDA